MTLGAALAAAPGIDPVPRDAVRELALMQRLAAAAAAFTPLVSIEPPDGLLLEIKPSITLFGGLRALCRRLRDACLANPVFAIRGRAQPHFTLAPTALAALVAARAGARCFITDPAVLPARLKPLPLGVLRWPEEQNARLAAMGVHTLGELMRLPRAGSRGASVPRSSRISTGCLAGAPIRAGASGAARVIAGASISTMKSRSRTDPAGARAAARPSSSRSCARASAASRRCNAAFIITAPRPTLCTLRLAAPEASAERSRPAARTPGNAGAARARAALRVARAARSPTLRWPAAAVVAGRTRPCQHGRNARAGRAPARPARRAGGVWHSPRAGTSAGERLAHGRARDRRARGLTRGAPASAPPCAGRCGCSPRHSLWNRSAAVRAWRGAAVAGRSRAHRKRLVGRRDVRRDYYVAANPSGALCGSIANAPAARAGSCTDSSGDERAAHRATPSCTASATSVSCAAPRIRRSWCERAQALGYAALALTDECSSPASCARMPPRTKTARHPAHRRQRVHARRRPAASSLLADQPRAATASCARLDHARPARGGEGQLPAHARRTVERWRLAGLPRAVAAAAPQPRCATRRAWLARALRGPRSGSRSSCCRAAATASGSTRCSALGARARPAARRRRRRAHARARAPRAAGHADRDPPQHAGRAMRASRCYPNGERHLRSRARLATLYPPRAARARRWRSPSAAAFSLDELRYEYPRRARAARARRRRRTCASSTEAGRDAALARRRCRRKCAS